MATSRKWLYEPPSESEDILEEAIERPKGCDYRCLSCGKKITIQKSHGNGRWCSRRCKDNQRR